MEVVDSAKRAVSSFLKSESPRRTVIREIVGSIGARLPGTVIFGGMLRELALGNTREFYSDVDLVTASSGDEIYRSIEVYEPLRNRFGGFRFVSSSQRVDIWCVRDTWAFREGLVKGDSVDDLPKTTFFNLDAAVFHLEDHQYRCSDNFVKGLKGRCLEINLSANPSPEAMCVKAVSLIFAHDLAVGPKLGNFLIEKSWGRRHSPVVELFYKGLKRHVEANVGEPFVFFKQATLF